MLHTNSKKAIENIRNYIRMNTDFSGYDADLQPKTDSFSDLAKAVMHVFYIEKVMHDKRRMSYQAYFIEWMEGLPTFGIGDFYLYRETDAKHILMTILEETEAEADKYTEAEANNLLTYLIFRELFKACGYEIR